MKVELTREQYLALVKLVCLGNTVANGIRDDEERMDDLDGVEQYLFSLAPEFGLAGLFEKEEEIFVPGRDLEEEMSIIMADYDDECFWDELVNRMARRDLVKSLGETAVKKLKPQELAKKEDPLIDRYDREAAAHGIDNLRFVNLK